jgi:hypothetical protein
VNRGSILLLSIVDGLILYVCSFQCALIYCHNLFVFLLCYSILYHLLCFILCSPLHISCWILFLPCFMLNIATALTCVLSSMIYHKSAWSSLLCYAELQFTNTGWLIILSFPALQGNYLPPWWFWVASVLDGGPWCKIFPAMPLLLQ